MSDKSGRAIEHDPEFRGEKPQICPYCGGDLEIQSGTNGMYQCKEKHNHQWALVIEGTPSGDAVYTLISREGVAVRE